MKNSIKISNKKYIRIRMNIKVQLKKDKNRKEIVDNENFIE